eukprot:scaffold2107_cov127-Isochrysis_galbana.AAC.12
MAASSVAYRSERMSSSVAPPQWSSSPIHDAYSSGGRPSMASPKRSSPNTIPARTTAATCSRSSLFLAATHPAPPSRA